MTGRVFIFDSHAQWLKVFGANLRAIGYEMKFALTLHEFKLRFVESETDVLILRGIDDLETFEQLKAMLGVIPSCGLIWIYPKREYLNSPYFQMADHRLPNDTTDGELVAVTQSLFNLLKRNGWR